MKKLYHIFIFTYVESRATKFARKKLNFDDNDKNRRRNIYFLLPISYILISVISTYITIYLHYILFSFIICIIIEAQINLIYGV